MSDQTIGAIISGLVGISVAVMAKTDLFNREHGNINKDIDIYKALPDNSKSKDKLLKIIDKKIIALVENEEKLRRDMAGVTLAVLFIGAGAYLTWFFFNKGSWWLIGLTLSIFMIILGIVGFVQDISKLERGKHGRPVKKDSQNG